MKTTTMINGKRNGTVPAENPVVVDVVIDGSSHAAHPGERLVDLINRVGVKLAQVCYHPQLGPIQTCDTCLVEINGQLVRACATTVSEGMSISTVRQKPMQRSRRHLIASLVTTCFTAPSATITMEIARYTTQRSC